MEEVLRVLENLTPDTLTKEINAILGKRSANLEGLL